MSSTSHHRISPAPLKAVRDQLQLFVQTPLKTKKKTSRRKEKERQKPRSSKNKVKVQKRSSNKGSKLHGNRHHPQAPGASHSEEEEAVPVATVSYAEKKQLSLDINRLPGGRLGRLVKMVQRHEPDLQVAGCEEVEIDIETLAPTTLRALQAFVARCLRRHAEKTRFPCEFTPAQPLTQD
ncbi:Bromodomain testis-specific protein [Merluccius polli]|uniref:Bromodomain testis-specific protein n=1 Tax=Merluccius polli TaxID=89951 RepID=A0AA47MAH6_MERPO|nr:Bromodomain testis-specific protein [Merluccius polli]